VTDLHKRVAIVLFPGSNCEVETARAVEAAGMRSSIVRWNERLDPPFDAYILPGGWSYEDRVRAGAVAAHDSVMRVIRDEADLGKPVLGICNGAQILAEAGMVPGSSADPRVALAPNERGYRCAWVRLRLVAVPARTDFTCAFEPGEIVEIPIAHGEGRFVTRDAESDWLMRVAVFQYCDSAGNPASHYPDNPNGSVHALAAISNEAGNVVAMMPHPERASWWRQHPPGIKERASKTSYPPAQKIFESLRRSIMRE